MNFFMTLYLPLQISVTEKEQGSTSPYTGMTAALVEAMRERRKSFHDC